MSKVEALLGLVQSRDDVAVVRKLLLKLATKGGFSSEGSANWTEARLGDLGKWGSGGTPLRSQGNYYAGGTIPWLVIGDLNDAIVTKAATFITPEGLENSSASLLPENTLLIAMYGSIGKMGITGIQCATNQAIAHCKPTPEKVTLWYLFYALKSIQEDLLGRGQGLAQKNISQTILKAWTIPLPPLAEQKRIVAKVDELMALCDQLEAQLKERDVKQATLAKAALAKFNEDPTPENLELLFHPSFSIEPEDLRRSLLTLAVKGKLTSQSNKDEPAGVLLARVILEIKRTKRKSDDQDEEQPHSGAAFPFCIPNNWQWIGATKVAVMVSDQDKKIPTNGILESGKHPVVDQGKMFVRGYSNDSDKLIKVDEPIILFGDHTRQTKYIDFDFIVGADGVKLLQPIGIDPQYYFLSLRWLPLESRGYARHFKLLKASYIPIPPLEEQHRIVAKVKELEAILDNLENQLEASRTTGEKLLEAMVAELTSA